ncbi:MAG: PadR family transcriptional regulator [Acidimicrobiales bacterium]
MTSRADSSGLRRANDPPVLILTSLAGGAKHGHALLKDIEAFAGIRLGAGALYGAITRLEERGLIEALASDDRRRPYQITSAGTRALASVLAEMRDLADVGAARLKLSWGAS